MQGLVLTVALRDTVACYEAMSSAAEVHLASTPFSRTPARTATPGRGMSSARSSLLSHAEPRNTAHLPASPRTPELLTSGGGKREPPPATAAQLQSQEQVDRNQVEVLVCSACQSLGTFYVTSIGNSASYCHESSQAPARLAA